MQTRSELSFYPLEKLYLLFLITLFTGLSPLYAEYHHFNAYEKQLKTLASEYNDILTLESIGTSRGGKSIYAVTLGTGESENKPALALVAGVEGSDISASEVALLFIESVASRYQDSDSVTALLNEHTVYVLPRVNPDAAEYFFESPAYAHRYNLRAMDLDQDGNENEDGYNDLNNDGYITLMRIKDPTGMWIADQEYPQLMRKADAAAGENGEYRLYAEGVDDDADGQFNEDPEGGVNFNQNFTFQYQYFREGTGPHQVSEPNARAVADFCYNHKNIAAIFTFSPHDNLLHPWKAKPGSGSGNEPVVNVLTEDELYFNQLAENFKNITALSGAPEPHRGNGSFSEWAYFHFGRWSVSAPVWWPPGIQSEKDTTGTDEQNSERGLGKYSAKFQQDVQLLNWLRATGQDEKILSWMEVEHPDFTGKLVEVGGFAPYAHTNPPADSLESLSKYYTTFLLSLAQSLPDVAVENIRVEALENNVFRISATVLNTGVLPTSTQLGTRIQWVPKVRVELTLSGDQQLASGRPLQIIDKLERSAGGREIRWLVVGDRNSTVDLTIGSPSAGMYSRTITLR